MSQYAHHEFIVCVSIHSFLRQFSFGFLLSTAVAAICWANFNLPSLRYLISAHFNVIIGHWCCCRLSIFVFAVSIKYSATVAPSYCLSSIEIVCLCWCCYLLDGFAAVINIFRRFSIDYAIFKIRALTHTKNFPSDRGIGKQKRQTGIVS